MMTRNLFFDRRFGNSTRIEKEEDLPVAKVVIGIVEWLSFFSY